MTDIGGSLSLSLRGRVTFSGTIVAANVIRALRRRRRINSVTAHCYVVSMDARAGRGTLAPVNGVFGSLSFRRSFVFASSGLAFLLRKASFLLVARYARSIIPRLIVRLRVARVH